MDIHGLAAAPPPFEPFFHSGTGALRFWVLQADGQYIGATITKQTLHYCFHADSNGDNAIGTYEVNRQRIDDAVRRRSAAGSREPVMLRDADVTAPQAPGP
ncbi:DUF1488 family protein [Ideonella sp. BN130291]|uniref:DUF1488 family protein n=1 Tax=Ideonella sp. BN130291 TaxID=3112940 RepID=UPI002E2672A1|nr:DUF1488 family protein [Ideonella sp. BN130291]